MLEWASNHLVLVAACALVAALALYAGALRRSRAEAKNGSRPAKDRSDVLMALANALMTGVVLTLAVVVLQQTGAAQRDRVTRLLMTADLSGYDPGPDVAARGEIRRSAGECVEKLGVIRERGFLKDRYLAARTMNGARLGGLNLDRTEFRDTRLRGAILRCSSLVGATLQHADLSAADLRGDHLTKANLRGANLDNADVPLNREAWAGAQVDASTCWPQTVTEEWIRSLPVARPLAMRAPRYPAAFGHFCHRDTPLLVKGVVPPSSHEKLPLAAGETRPP